MKNVLIIVTTFASSHFANAQNVTSVYINKLEWMANNLNVTVYWDGTPIPEARNTKEWRYYNEHKIGCYCKYDNEDCYASMYGYLYNWYAIKYGVAPRCWRVATKADFDQLVAYLGIDSAARKLKGTHSWNNDWNGNNKSGFNALAAGCRNANGTFSYVGRQAFWWMKPEDRTGKEKALYFFINYDDKLNYEPGNDFGYSVRCVRDIGKRKPQPCD